MPIEILMPALSPTMKEGTLAKWFKKKGDKVKAGDVIAEIETDKALMEVEAVDEGEIGEILVNEGSVGVLVNSPIAVLKIKGDDELKIAEFISSLKKPNAKIVPETENIPEAKNDTLPTSENIDITAKRVFASPLARNIAKAESVDINQITGSGPYQRIIKADVLEYLNSIKITKSVISQSSQDTIIPITGMRKAIADRLMASKQEIPHFYLSIDVVVDKLLSIREEINSDPLEKSKKISINDFVVKFVASALKKFPMVNSSYTKDGLLVYGNVDISIAVSIEGGLITPIVKNADLKSLFEISTEIKDLAKRARENRLRLDEFQGGGFSISNLGMYGIDNFSAIINPPQSAILAVGASKKIPIVINDDIAIGNVINLTLSCDHRVIDGALAAEFLSYIKQLIENPLKALLVI